MIRSHFLALLTLCALVASSSTAPHSVPIIGVLTQPCMQFGRLQCRSYIAASYVKYLESGGARVVPVFHNSTPDELDKVFSRINGLFLPGGEANTSTALPLYRAAAHLMERAMDASNFPVLGHCQGLELMAKFFSGGNDDVLIATDAEDLPLPLNISQRGQWLQDVPQHIFQVLQGEPVTINLHRWGLAPRDALKYGFRVLSTNRDRKGVQFVSLLELGANPLFKAMQFHAEKVAYEFYAPQRIPHSGAAVQAMNWFALRAVDLVRTSGNAHGQSQEQLAAHLIGNTPPLESAAYSHFQQIYLFH